MRLSLDAPEVDNKTEKEEVYSVKQAFASKVKAMGKRAATYNCGRG